MLRMKQYSRGWPATLLLVALAAVAFLLYWEQPVYAQRAARTEADGSVIWQASYWNNMTLSGTPTVVRNESALSYDWGAGSPDPAINADHFSARWSCTIWAAPGNYRFTATSDDGIRLFVDDQLLINQWYDHAVRVDSAELYLVERQYTIRVEFYENEGLAVARLGWQRITDQDRNWPSDDEWRGEYYNNRDLSGSSALVRYDHDIDFDWGSGSPDSRIDSDNFSVRWTRSLYFSDDQYRFVVNSDDGVRLYIDGDRKIDAWVDMAATRHTYETHLSAGTHTIRLEYYEHHGSALVELYWTRMRTAERPVGNLITYAPPQPYNYAWIKIYRRDGDEWVAMTPKGIGAISASGFLKVDGLPVDVGRYGGSGHPYCIELWVNGQMVNAVGNTDRGEAEFRIYADRDNYTPWQGPPS